MKQGHGNEAVDSVTMIPSHLTIVTHTTVDQENFVDKIISRSRPTAKLF